MIEVSRIIHQRMARSGLIMHIRRNRKPSKTKAMYHPPSLQKCKNLPEDTPKEATCAVAEGYVTFTRKFKCLGLWVIQDLCNDTDTAARIGKATAQVYCLVNIWRNKHITKELKNLLYLQLPLKTTALWEAESWTLTVERKRRLQQFHHSVIGKIMNIMMFEVEANCESKTWGFLGQHQDYHQVH